MWVLPSGIQSEAQTRAPPSNGASIQEGLRGQHVCDPSALAFAVDAGALLLRLVGGRWDVTPGDDGLQRLDDLLLHRRGDGGGH